MLTLFTYILLILISAIAKLEEIFTPKLLRLERNWMVNYRFTGGSKFCQFCRQIPTECPATKIGLPPMCKLNPLYDHLLLMQLKAADPEHQNDWIEMGHSM